MLHPLVGGIIWKERVKGKFDNRTTESECAMEDGRRYKFRGEVDQSTSDKIGSIYS